MFKTKGMIDNFTIIIQEQFFSDFYNEILLFLFINVVLIIPLYLKTNDISIILKITCSFYFIWLLIPWFTNIQDLKMCIKLFLILTIISTLNIFLRERNKIYNYEPIIIINILIFGLLILINNTNLIVLLLSLEIYTYAAYILISSKTTSLLSTEGGLKYLIISSLSTALFLTGIISLYWYYGSINLDEIYLLYQFNNSNILLLLCTLFFISLFIKIGAAPFHLWYLDAYQNLDFWVLCLLNVVPKIAMIFIFFQLSIYINIVYIFSSKYVLYIIAFISVVISNITVTSQLNFKRLLLYYTIQGNAFLALLIASAYIEHWNSIFFYIICYGFTYINIFCILASFRNWIQIREQFFIYNYFNIFSQNTVYCWNLVCIIFNLIAIPPFVSFGAKLLILITTSNTFPYIITCILLLNVITIPTYLRIINLVFFSNNTYTYALYHPIKYQLAFIISLITGINLLAFVSIHPFNIFLNNLWF